MSETTDKQQAPAKRQTYVLKKALTKHRVLHPAGARVELREDQAARLKAQGYI